MTSREGSCLHVLNTGFPLLLLVTRLFSFTTETETSPRRNPWYLLHFQYRDDVASSSFSAKIF